MTEFSNYGGVGIMGFISPMDTRDTYAVIDPIYGIDGIRNVSDINELNSITLERRRSGMFVGIEGGTRYFKLKDVVWSFDISDWEEIFFYTISQTAITSNQIVGGTLNYSTKTLTLDTSSGGTITITGLTDTYITGGTYNQESSNLELTNNYGNTIEITGFTSPLNVSGNTGLGIENSLLFTTYNTLLDPTLEMGSSIGGLEQGTKVSNLSGKSFVKLFDELLFPTLQPTYTIPTISLNITNQKLEVGSKYNQSITVTGRKNDAGEFSYFRIMRSGDEIGSTFDLDKTSAPNIPDQFGYQNHNNPNFNFSFTYDEDFVIPLGLPTSSTEYIGVGSYFSGLPKNTNKGTLDTRFPQTRSINAPQSSDSSFETTPKIITGIFPFYYGVLDTEPTIEDVVNSISNGTANKVLTEASGNITINFNTTTKFLWFAHLSNYEQKTQWFVSSDNKGLMSSSSLFKPGVVSSVDSELGYWSNVNFLLYLGNYATTINTVTLGNNLF
jgi:hypothetical protein